MRLWGLYTRQAGAPRSRAPITCSQGHQRSSGSVRIVSSLLQHDKSRPGGTLEDLWKNRNVVVVHTVDGQRVRLAVTSLN